MKTYFMIGLLLLSSRAFGSADPFPHRAARSYDYAVLYVQAGGAPRMVLQIPGEEHVELTIADLSNPRVPSSPSMKKGSTPTLVDVLGKMGSDGWELVSVYELPSKGQWHYVFKRLHILESKP
jgi:hypothetical protein